MAGVKVIDVFNEQFHDLVKDGLQNAFSHTTESAETMEDNTKNQWIPQNLDSIFCVHCRVEFDNNKSRREHLKTDWHLYNFTQVLRKKETITEEEFLKKTEQDDLSSSSESDESDSEEKEDPSSKHATVQGKIYLCNREGNIFSLYSNILKAKREQVPPEVLLERLTECSVKNQKWAVLMLGGGHFAGAVFDGRKTILHKTFHYYIVRAGQGGSQSARDAQSATSKPKSAGANLRRQNEKSLLENVRKTLETWKDEIAASSLVFYRASGSYNLKVLFGGPVLDQEDPRLRTIATATKRASQSEVNRVHSLLSQVTLYDSLDVAKEDFDKKKQTEASNVRKPRQPATNRAKSREPVQRPDPIPRSASQDSSTSGDSVHLTAQDETISLQDALEPFGDSLTPAQRNRQKQKRRPRKAKTQKQKEEEAQKAKYPDPIVGILAGGLIDQLEEELKQISIDKVVDIEENTLLHVAAMKEQSEVVQFLLERGANPCLRNVSKQPVYVCTKNKEVREVLRNFARENPDKYDYNKALIPMIDLTPEQVQELAEKKKARRKLKQEREKEKKKEAKKQKEEEEERQKFLKLSDREKRALAAERRILNQSGTVKALCFTCGSDISGKVPFEYSNNRFCSIACLKSHRIANPTL